MQLQDPNIYKDCNFLLAKKSVARMCGKKANLIDGQHVATQIVFPLDIEMNEALRDQSQKSARCFWETKSKLIYMQLKQQLPNSLVKAKLHCYDNLYI